MSSSVGALSEEIPSCNPFAQTTRVWTEGEIKTKKFVFYTLATTFATAGTAITYTAAAITPPGAICTIAAIALGLYAYSLTDYKNPDALQAIRKKASGMPLLDVVAEHGWNNVFLYEILESDTLVQAYREHIASLSFKDMLSLYHEASASVYSKDYPLPSPKEYQDLFISETKALRCDTLVALYPIEDLRLFDLVSDGQLQILEKVATLNRDFNVCADALDQEFYNRTQKEHQILAKAYKPNYKPHTTWDSTRGSSPTWMAVPPDAEDLLQAEQEFSQATAPVRREIDARFAEKVNEYNLAIAALEGVYKARVR